MNLTKQITVALCILFVSTNASMIGDFLEGAKNFWPNSKDLSVESKLKILPKVQYELPADNEEFIQEALKLIDAPRESLDVCTHRVVHMLKKDCNKLNLEEIGKLAVMMLNCQLEIEGRQTFSCKPEMTLSQCTIGMDSQMHQVYNYMTHRAVGICSALRQDQFRAASEMTVNRLMEATQAQLKAIHETLKNQKLLNDMELENMNQFSKNDDQIKESQLQSLEKLKMAENIIDVTLTSLQQELELHKKSEAKLETIDSVTTEIAFRLAKHSAELHEEHKKIIEDVKEISTNLQLHNLQLLQQYNETLEFIADFRSVMLTLSSIANNIKNYVDSLFATLQEVGPGLTHELLVFLFLNLVYFMCGTIFMVFWNIQEKFCKFLLVALFLFNCCAVYNRAEVELIPLNIFAWLSFAVVKVLGFIKKRLFLTKFRVPKFFKLNNSSVPDESDSEEEDLSRYREPSTTPIPRSPQQVPRIPVLLPSRVKVEASSFSRRISHDDNEMTEIFRSVASSSTLKIPETSSIAQRSSTPISLSDRPMTPAMRRVLNENISQPDRSATPFANQNGRVQCQGLTIKGIQCKNAATPGSNRCRMHT